MTKIIIFLFGIGMAHVTRCMMIAKELRKRKVTVSFAAGIEAATFLQKHGWKTHLLPEITRDVHNEIYTKNHYRHQNTQYHKHAIVSELKILNNEKPDVVVYGSRLTAKVSATIAKIPTISIINTFAIIGKIFKGIAFKS